MIQCSRYMSLHNNLWAASTILLQFSARKHRVLFELFVARAFIGPDCKTKDVSQSATGNQSLGVNCSSLCEPLAWITSLSRREAAVMGSSSQHPTAHTTSRKIGSPLMTLRNCKRNPRNGRTEYGSQSALIKTAINAFPWEVRPKTLRDNTAK